MLYGNEAFDPTFITWQIICLQSSIYCVFGILLGVISHGIYGESVGLGHLFDFDRLTFRDGQATANSILWLISGLFGGFCVYRIVERVKKCLDFTVTFYFIHMIFSIAYKRSFPRDWQSWLVTVLAATLMDVVGEWLCMNMEMQDIRIEDIFTLSPTHDHDKKIQTPSSKYKKKRKVTLPSEIEMQERASLV